MSQGGNSTTKAYFFTVVLGFFGAGDDKGLINAPKRVSMLLTPKTGSKVAGDSAGLLRAPETRSDIQAADRESKVTGPTSKSILTEPKTGSKVAATKVASKIKGAAL